MRVGTSHIQNLSAFQAEDHPHACGDKSSDCATTGAAVGSSPCVWGQDDK